MAGLVELRAGAFVLEELLGRGGTSDVWRARHRSGAVAAVKVLRAQLVEDSAVREALRHEVEAVARLEHPSIALVLDFGEIGDDESHASRGRLATGAPWLALELASGGTLSSLRATTWTSLRDTLSVLLGALAHAHARGFIHRDLKPANVLVSTAADARPGLKLSDFGLARALDAEERRADGMLAGTPAYMSPEQFRLDDAALAPWSDLYALGCLAFALATGRPPFEGSWSTLLRAHVEEERPALPALPGAPAALSAWVRRLLEPEPSARFCSAADARFALHALDDSEPPDPRLLPSGLLATASSLSASLSTPPVRSLPQEEPTEGWRIDDGLATAPTRVRGTPTPTSAGHAHRAALPALARASPRAATRAPTVVPPLPSSWRLRWRDDAGAPRTSLLGAGLGLYALREVAISGREYERDALWRALVEVDSAGRPRAVVLRGNAGTGKSRLASWLCRRAHEVGGIVTFRALHDVTLPSSEALARMASRHLGLPAHAGPAETLEHVRRWVRHHGLDDDEATSIASLVHAPSAAGARLAPDERHERLRRLIGAATLDRPVIVWLDDIQWGDDALRFAERLLDGDARVLVVVTAREEALTDAPVVAALDALEQRQRVARIDLRPLDATDHRALVGELLHLAPDLARRVAERTVGSPLFAVQLVGDWVQRGLLELGPRGFELPPGADVRLPDELHDVWTSHVERLVRVVGPGAREALELAATLGQDVSFLEWRAACALIVDSLPLLDELVDAMVRARLAERYSDGSRWSFSHGALRESVSRTAREGGRSERHHRRIADALVDMYGAEASGVSDRVGAHLVSAREHAAALDALVLAARERIARGEWLQARRLLDLHEDAASALELPDDDARRAEPLLLRARADIETGGALEDALHAAGEVHRRQELPTWQPHQPGAWLLSAYIDYRRGALPEAARAFRYARGWGKRVGDEDAELHALLGLGDVEYYEGDRRSAGRRYREALPIADRRGDVRLTVRCLWSLGYVDMWAGRLSRARRLFERQLELCRQEGDSTGVARALSSLSEVHRLGGDYDLAERLMREALVPLERAGAVRSAAIGRLNLLCIDVARGRLASARHALEELLPAFRELHEPPVLAITHALLAACAASAREESVAEQHLSEVESIIVRRNYVEGDLADALERAGLYALDRGFTDIALRALVLARQQWLHVGREDHADVIARRLAELTPPL